MLGRKITTNTILLRFYDASLKACMYWCSRYHVKISIYMYIYIYICGRHVRAQLNTKYPVQEPSPHPFILLASNWVDFWYGLHVHSWLSTSLARMSVWHLMDLRFWCAVIRRDPSIQDVVFFVDVCLLEVTSFLQGNVQAWLASWRDFLEVLDNYVGTQGLCSEHCELRLFCELMEGPS